jgi:hypothetical protein
MLLAVAPVGPEFLVNSTTFGPQNDSSVATDAAGDFVTTWQSYFQDGSANGIYAQRYNAAGATQGGEVRVNTFTTNNQTAPAVAMDNAGDFVITWQSYGQDGSGDGVYAQRYDAAGAKQGSEFRVNTYTAQNQILPAVAMDGAGDFVITWWSFGQDGSDYGVYAQRYNPAGVKQGGEFRVNSTTTGRQGYPAVAMDTGGDFVVAWQDSGPQVCNYYGCSPGPGDIYAQRYNPAGVKQGSEFRVNSTTANDQANAAVAMDTGGNFVVTWSGNGPGDVDGVFAQLYNSAGVKQGVEFRVNSTTANSQGGSVVAMDTGGNFVVTWSGNGPGDADGVFAQLYNSAGVKQGVEFRVNSTTANSQGPSVVAMDTDGDFVVTWEGYGRGGSDIYAQQYQQVSNPASVGDFVWNDANGNGIQDSGEAGVSGVKVQLLTTAGTQANSTVTDASGHYLFDNLRPGDSYYVQFSLPSGYILAPQDQGSDDSLDSDVDAFGRTPTITLGAGQTDLSVDAGLVKPASISGTLYNDSNGSGSRDAGEAGLGNWIVFLDANANGTLDPTEANATTGANGSYSLTGLRPGSSKLQFMNQIHWSPTTSVDGFLVVNLTVGQALTGVDFGERTSVPLVSATKAGAEFRVNTTTAGNQELAKNAMDQNGNFVVVWDGPDSNLAGIYAQRYNATGQKQGNEFRVNTYTTNQQDFANVKMDHSGNFIIAWESTLQDGDQDGIYVQRYDATGAKVGSEFRANTLTAGSQEDPQIAFDAAGNFIIAWSDSQNDGSGWGIYAQRYNADGSKNGAQFRVNIYTSSDQRKPAIAIDDAGDFAIAWQSKGQDGDDYGIYAQRYDPSGQAVGGEFRVNTTTALVQFFVNAAMDAVGNFIITWHSQSSDGSGTNAFAQRYDASGVPQGSEFRLNTYTNDNQLNVYVAMDAGGDFVATWQSFYQDGSGSGIYGQRYNAAGLKEGSEFRANSTTADNQVNDSVSMDTNGDFVVTWQTNGPDQCSYYGCYPGPGDIYAQRYVTNKPPTTTGISNITLSSGAPDTLVDLFSAFADDIDPDNKLIYTLRGNTNPSLFTSTAIDSVSGKLTLAYAPNATGFSNITLRATDTGGLFVETTFAVTIQPAAFPLVVNGADPNDNIVLKQSGTDVMVWINHDPASDPADITRTLASITSISVNGGLGDDTLTLDFTNGNPIPAGGLFVNGGGNDTINFIGTGAPGRPGVAAVSGSLTLTGGNITLVSDANGLSVTVSNDAVVNFATSQHLAALTLADNAKATLAADGGHFIRTSTFSIAPTATFDLTDNDLILQADAASRAAVLAAISNFVKIGRNNGAWTGVGGITSSTAAAQPNHLTGLPIALNDKGAGTPLYTTFDGVAVDNNAILVKYSWNGDADLSGKIDSDDYFQIDNGFVLKLTGYRNGDFDFNNAVDADDYFLIDKAFVGQTSVLAANVLASRSSSKTADKNVRATARHRTGRHHQKGH